MQIGRTQLREQREVSLLGHLRLGRDGRCWGGLGMGVVGRGCCLEDCGTGIGGLLASLWVGQQSPGFTAIADRMI